MCPSVGDGVDLIIGPAMAPRRLVLIYNPVLFMPSGSIQNIKPIDMPLLFAGGSVAGSRKLALTFELATSYAKASNTFYSA
jgi:hypothetical protein